MISDLLPTLWTIDAELRNQLKPTAIGDAFLINTEEVGELVEHLESTKCGSIKFYRCNDVLHRLTFDYELKAEVYDHAQQLIKDYVSAEFYISPGILSMYCTPESNIDPRGEMIPDNLYQKLGFIKADPPSNTIFTLDDIKFYVDRLILPGVSDYDLESFSANSSTVKMPSCDYTLEYNKSIVVCKQRKPKVDQLHFSDTYRIAYMLACELITMIKEEVVTYAF